MKFSIDEIVKNSDVEIITNNLEDGLFEISTDTRKIQKGNLYLPLRGENFDGHNFIDKAIELGAVGYFTQDKRKINKNAKIILYTKNSLITYLQLARYIRKKINPKVIAVTGSCGKTTVKEMLASTLATEFKVHKSILNHNNEIGLCETMFNMPLDTEVEVIEMGMRNLGEIQILSEYCLQNYAIITNVGSAHVEKLGSLNNIAVAKCEIASYLNKNDILYAHDSKLIRKNINFEGKIKYLSVKDVDSFKIEKNLTTFIYKGLEYQITVEGEHNIENALFAIELANDLGISYENIKKGLLAFKPIEKRWEITEHNGVTYINDSYNANPESMKAVLKTFLSVYDKSNNILVLGDMLELGHNEIKYHIEIGEFIKKYGNVKLVTVGKLAKYISKNNGENSVHFSNNADCAKYLKGILKKGDVLLFKASRSMKFEEIIEMVGEKL